MSEGPVEERPGPTTRERILAAIRAEPGRPVQQVRGALGVSWGAFSYHLKTLEQKGLVSTEVSGRRKLLFPVELATEAERHRFAAQSVLRGKSAREVYEAIEANPGIDLTKLRLMLDISKRSVYYHVPRLIDVGLVRSSSETRHTGLVAIPPEQATPPRGAQEHTRETLLRQPIPHRLALAIQENPGASFSAVLRKSGLPRSSMEQTLQALEEAGVARSERAAVGRRGNHRRYLRLCVGIVIPPEPPAPAQER